MNKRRYMQLTIMTASLIISVMAGCTKEESKMKAQQALGAADSLFQVGDFEKAMTGYEEAAMAAEKANSKDVLTEAYSQIARCHLKLERLDSGKEWLARAGKIADKKQATGWSRFLGVRGRFEWREAASETHEPAPVVDKAATTFREMYAYCMLHDLHERAIDAANMLSIVGPPSEKIDWGLKGIKAAEDGALESWLGPLWNNLGWNYDEIGEYDRALEALKKAREYHYKSERAIPRLVADWSVCVQLRKTGQIDSARAIMVGVLSKAESLYADQPTSEHSEWVGLSHREMGEIELASAGDKKALEAFRKAKAKLEEAGMADWDAKGFGELADKIKSLESTQQ